MTATELQEQTGKTFAAIKGKHYRMKLGTFDKMNLRPELVAALTGQTEPKKTRTVSAKVCQPLASSQSREPVFKEAVLQTEPEAEVTRTVAEPKQDEPEQTSEPEQTKPATDNAEPPVVAEQTAKPSSFDPGDLFMFSPTARFVFVTVLMSGGAWIFASLVNKVFPDELNRFGFVMFFCVGFLVDASGLILARTYKRSDKWDSAGLVWFFLGLLFVIQVAIEASYIFWETEFTWIGLLIASVRPLGQLVYSSIYLNNNKA